MPAYSFCQSFLASLVAGSMLASIGASAEDFDRDAALNTVKVLAADEMGGRAAGSEGNALARTFLLDRIKGLGLEPIGAGYEHKFTFSQSSQARMITGTNLLFKIEGIGNTGRTIVVSAHYDHVGTYDGQIFNGADDNASGVAGALAVAESFKKSPPQNDIVFALFDAEEMGLKGAVAFAADKDLMSDSIKLNINFDMLSRSDKNELYVAGVGHNPELKEAVEAIAAKAPVKLLMGHDDPALGNNDWTNASDHAPFHREGIPFLYFGVEDHPHYHQPSDDFETIPADFFIRSIETVVMAAHELDKELAK